MKPIHRGQLQIRAEEIGQRMHRLARRPIVFEFAGSPKAGKTTAITQVVQFLRRCGFRVEVVVERASLCPIFDKKHATFNVWTACTSLAALLEKTQFPQKRGSGFNPEILILDRGIFDAICWMRMLENLSRLQRAERRGIEQFLLLDEWRKRISAVILMVASPQDSLVRDRGELPVAGKVGSIMNRNVLQRFRSTIDAAGKELKDQFRIFQINTSSSTYNKPKASIEKAVEVMLDITDQHLSEEILCLPKSTIEDHFGTRDSLAAKSTPALISAFVTKGTYKPRHSVETSSSLIQALPVVVVRNKSGDILLLRRREANQTNPLNEKLVIWAGGHVREEDGGDGRAIENCIIRELREELRLCVSFNQLKLLGAIWTTSSSEKTRRHCAIVYEWRSPSDDVEIALSNSEFFEGRGTSLSGTFTAPGELLRRLNSKDKGLGIVEPWSAAVIRNLLAETQHQGDVLL